jgi:hypothetical protein
LTGLWRGIVRIRTSSVMTMFAVTSNAKAGFFERANSIEMIDA